MAKIDRTNRTRLAEIRWRSTEEGGRKSLPSGVERPPYAPIVRLLDPDERVIGEPGPGVDPPAGVVRSLVVNKLEGDDELTHDGAEWLAEVAYRADDASHEALSVGCRFELYEGARCVATGVVIGFAGDRSPCSAMLEPFDR